MKKIVLLSFLISLMFGEVIKYSTDLKSILDSKNIAISHGGEKNDYEAVTDGIGVIVYTPTNIKRKIDNTQGKIFAELAMKAKNKNQSVDQYISTNSIDSSIQNILNENPIKEPLITFITLEPDLTYSTTCNWVRDSNNPNKYTHTDQFSTIHFVLPNSGIIKIKFYIYAPSYYSSVAAIGSRPDIYPICNKHLGDWNSNTNNSKISLSVLPGSGESATDTFVVNLDNKTVYLESNPSNIVNI